ncbi:MAG: gliding motility-associated C-terminal domain-containing protein, partial [Sphingomonadales bacterium]
MKKYLYLCLLLVLAKIGYTQKEANVWHFGAGHSLDFNSGSPVQTSGSQIFTFEGSTSYCDENGNLLFYSNGGGRIPASGQDGGKIWNKNNEVMYDMQGVEGGGWSAAQSSVIVPAPGEPNVFYLFTMEEQEHYVDATPTVLAAEPNGRGFRYFKIDMSLNGGLGDVIEADVPVYDYSFEGICAIRHANDSDYWILINQDTSGIGVYSVTPNGVQLAGVYPAPTSTSGGVIKASPFPFIAGQTCCNKVMTPAGLFDFDLSTGQLSFETDLGGNLTSSFEFSPNGFYLYATLFDQITSNSQLLQYDILLASQTGQSLESTAQVISTDFDGVYMQLAPDGKIYFTEPTFDPFTGDFITILGTINCPNTLSPTISSDVFSYTSDGVNTFGFFTLPNFPSWIFYNSYEAQIQFGPDTVSLCPGETLLLNAGNGTSWQWGGDASTNSGQFYTVTSPGIYSATVNGPCGLGSDQIVVLDCSYINITASIDTCTNEEISFNINTNLLIEQIIEWNFGDPASGSSNTSQLGTPTHIYSSPGSFTVSCIVQINCSTPPDINNPIGTPCFYEDTLYYTLNVVNCPNTGSNSFLVPNVITPNSDGVNDLFEIQNLPLNTEVIILNRWGNTVYSSTNYQNNWDGKDASGKELLEGVYTYQFKTESGKTGHG